MINTKDKTIIKNYCYKHIKEKDAIRVRLLALYLTEHYALFEIIDYIKNELNIADEHIWRCKDTYISYAHGHLRISKSDLYYSNVYLHQYVVHKAFNIPLKTLGKYIIHHIDSNKHNNSLSNLFIFYNSALHREFHVELKKNPDVSIIRFTKDWIEDNLNAENMEELKEYLKLILRVENDKKCLSLDGLGNVI